MTTTWPTGKITANGIEMHYTHTGGDKPPLVLAHGFSDHGMCWVCVAKAFEATHDCIMIDARGHGLSTRADQPFSSDDMARDLIAAIETLGFDRPPVFGHSMGASTAAIAAVLAPERIGALILEDPPWFETQPERNLDDDNSWEKGVTRLRTRSFDDVLAQARVDNPGWHEDELHPWVESKMQMDMRVFRDIHHNSHFFDWREIIPNLACPTLLLTADPARGALVTPKMGQAIAEASPRVRWVQIADAGHSVHRDQFDDSMAAVRAFLQENGL